MKISFSKETWNKAAVLAAQSQPALKEKVMCRARPTGAINTYTPTKQILLWSGALYQWLECSQIHFNFWDWKVKVSSLLFINLTAAVIRGGALHRRVFMFCIVDCSLELEGKCTLPHEHIVTQKKGSPAESWVQWEVDVKRLNLPHSNGRKPIEMHCYL